MKLFEREHNSMVDALECAGQLMDTVPLIMRTLRNQLRLWRPEEFSIPQFRVLAFLRDHGGATLSDVANHIGLMRPTMSKMIENLVKRQWVVRESSAQDRRCIKLRLTENGLEAIDQARRNTRECLAESIRRLDPREQETIIRAMQLLQGIFTPPPAAADAENPAGAAKAANQ
jgi:DNA-binding MarR family transcriptional regulator